MLISFQAPEKLDQTCDANVSLSNINSNQMGPPNESATRNLITPKHHLPNLQVYIHFFYYIEILPIKIAYYNIFTKKMYNRVKMGVPVVRR